MDGDLSQIFRKRLPDVHWQRIESPLTGGGTPDLNGCVGGVEFWIENKLARGTKVKFRPFQVPWLERRSRAGGRCFVAVRRDDQLLLVPGYHARILEEEGITSALLRSGSWSGGPAKWDWAAIRRVLTS